ncbi:MAG TPA: polyphenol oxidase family protein [Chthoniobacteraceae bacterium]|nr:polyphenol oxidase family protein [Chthoniobacteraceae bacterium]
MTGGEPAHLLFETFAALSDVSGLRHGFTLRVPGVDVRADRGVALARLDQFHTQVREEIGAGGFPFVFGEQIHGANVALVGAHSGHPVPSVDGVVTDAPDVCLGVYVADCCAIYLVDPVTRAIGLAHSGKKGTEGNIAQVAVRKMVDAFGCVPGRIIAQLSPCIRPPHYEIDFAAAIREQLRAAGIGKVHDTNRCTACDPGRYYSYRAERGRTGRMLALLAWPSTPK